MNQSAPSNEDDMNQLVIEELKTIYDPELPVNIYALGLIYDVSCKKDKTTLLQTCHIKMTLTSATCSMSEVIVDLVRSISSRISFLEEVKVEIVFDPPWSQEKMSDEAKLEMGFL